MKSPLTVLALFVSVSAFADLRCWKPVGMVYGDRYWIEITALEGRTDLLAMQFGVGDTERMTEIHFDSTLLPSATGDNYRSDAGAPADVRFFRAKNESFEFQIYDRQTGKRVYRMKNLRCDP
jgi:hypothetical protein